MKVIYSPQVPHIPVEVEYKAEGDKLIVTLNGVTEEFDFTGMPNGQSSEIEAELLPLNPVFGARVKGGELVVTLASYVGPKPQREVVGYEDGENGDEILEDDASYQKRLEEWELSKTRRTVVI